MYMAIVYLLWYGFTRFYYNVTYKLMLSFSDSDTSNKNFMGLDKMKYRKERVDIVLLPEGCFDLMYTTEKV